jgi:hypothetical protein
MIGSGLWLTVMHILNSTNATGAKQTSAWLEPKGISSGILYIVVIS